MNFKKILCFLCLPVAFLLLASCMSDGEKETDTETESDTPIESVSEFPSESESESETETETETDEETTTEKAAQLRVMYYNVYGYGRMDSVPDRLGQQAAMINDQAPDVICTQEFDSRHRNGSKKLLAKYGYSEVTVSASGFVYPEGINCEAMFYRTDRLRIMECGGELFPTNVVVDGKEVVGNNGNTKSYTWAVFVDKQSGKLSLVINAHFMYNAPDLTADEADAVRLENAKIIISLIEKIRSSKKIYADIPVIFGGDLNSRTDGSAYKALSKAMSPARDVAEQYTSIGYYGGYATYDSETKEYTYKKLEEIQNPESIDHVFVLDTKVLSYVPVTEFRALITSDHLPWIVDIEL